MEKHPLFQSSWGRAWDDTNHFYQHKKLLFGVVEVVLVALGIFIANILTPLYASNWELGFYNVVGAVSGAIVGLPIVFGIFLFWAPYKQRSEARTLLQAKPKPIPLQNRKELIEAIASVENKTVQLINQQDALDKMTIQSPYTVNTEALAHRDEVHARWNESMNELRRQYLVAGDAFEKICVDFTGFIWIQVMSKMGQIKYSEDTKPLVLQDTLQFAGALAGRVKETIRKIDKISAQVPDNEGSQNI